SVPAIAAKLNITTGTKVLVFGDSMVDAGFAQKLRKLVEARGGTLVHDAWTSATTSTWSKGERLDNLLFVHKPDVVIVALGANEVFLPSPEAVAPRVGAIVGKLAPRSCFWVSPPLWKGETGIVAVERANASPCGFFDSGSIPVERAKDGIHPTLKGGGDWADAVWSAIVD
ncbi:MAG: SGNH/GDSL hydrolase family protein, partial [Polyangiales bacterium]